LEALMGFTTPLETESTPPADLPGHSAVHEALLADSGFSKPKISDDIRTNDAAVKSGDKSSSEFPSEYAVAKAFAAGNLLNKNWVPANSEQSYLLEHLGNAASELGNLPAGVVDGIASIGDVAPINKFLADHNLSMRLDKLGRDDVGIAGTLSISGQWNGRDSTISVDGKDYPAAHVSHVQTFQKNGTAVAKLYSKDGITVYAAPIGDDKLTGIQLTQRANQLTPDESTPLGAYNSVLIPKVDKDVTTELNGIKGMRATDDTIISQAKMQTKLAIDENGFSATQGVAMSVGRGLEMSREMKFDKPFIVWAVCDGCSQPLFATEVDKKYWKDPKASDKH
jgi:hypothetical protein